MAKLDLASPRVYTSGSGYPKRPAKQTPPCSAHFVSRNQRGWPTSHHRKSQYNLRCLQPNFESNPVKTGTSRRILPSHSSLCSPSRCSISASAYASNHQDILVGRQDSQFILTRCQRRIRLFETRTCRHREMLAHSER